MFIKKLHVKNFKSIKEMTIQFAPLSIIVGANASGKSNLINVFRFIGNIATEGIENAIALQGGTQYLTNTNLPKGTPVEISFTLDVKDEEWIRSKRTTNKEISLYVQEMEYKFVIIPNKKGTGFQISEDYLKMSFEVIDNGIKNVEEYVESAVTCATIYHRKSTKSLVQTTNELYNSQEARYKEYLDNDSASEFFSRWVNEDRKELMLYRISALLPPVFSEDTFIRIFDFDPKELKKSSSMVSARMLAENGSNIASVLQNIIRTKENRKVLTTLLHNFLPFVDGVSIESNLDKSFSYKIRENYSGKSFHANFLSDGTVSILALIVALYFEERSNIVILEEPERNIHPKLLENLLDAAEEVSKNKQIIITTHNPEFLKYAKLENIRLVSRDKNGFTNIKKPEDSEKVKIFIENELGLDDLFLNDMLGE